MSVKSSETTPGGGLVVLCGPSGVGKTFGAATFSEFFPHERVNRLLALQTSAEVARALEMEKWVELKDMLWIPWDEGALDGLRAFKIAVPFVDVQDIMAQNCDSANTDGRDLRGLPIMSRIAALVMQDIEAYARATPSCIAVVDDTISMFDLALSAYVFAKFPKPQCFDELDRVHKQDFERRRGQVPWRIANFHLEAIVDPIQMGKDASQAEKDAKLRNAAVKMAGDGKLTLAVGKKARRMFQGHGSYQLSVEAKRGPDGKLVRSFVTEVDSPAGVEARVRAEILCDTREPANLRAFLKKMGKL